jgi:hypothetical protein
MEMLGRLPDSEHDLHWEVNPGTENVQPCRQIVFEHPIAGARPVRITDRMRESTDLVGRKLAELGLTGAKPVEVYTDPNDVPWMNDLVVAFGGTPPPWTSVDLPAVRIQLATTYTVTGAYLRAIAKITFHYALTAFQELSGTEPEFSEIKQFIWDGTGGADRFVRQCTEQFIANFEAWECPTEWMHILHVRRTYMAITANAQFFAGPRSLPPGYQVSLGRNPARLHIPEERKAHLFIITDPDAKGPVGVVEDAQPANLILPVFNRILL